MLLFLVTGRAETAGHTDQEVFYKVLSKPENRYLVRQMCWVLTIQGLDTYILHPRDPRDFDRLVEAIRPQPSPTNMDVIIGLRGTIAPPEFCNGLMVPSVVFEQIYSFDRNDFIKAIPRPEKMTEKQHQAAANEVLDKIFHPLIDNAGATDEHRAMNSFAHQRHAQHRRCQLQVYSPQYRFHGEILRASEYGRDVSVSGDKVVAML
jgi:hypothetical protein